LSFIRYLSYLLCWVKFLFDRILFVILFFNFQDLEFTDYLRQVAYGTYSIHYQDSGEYFKYLFNGFISIFLLYICLIIIIFFRYFIRHQRIFEGVYIERLLDYCLGGSKYSHMIIWPRLINSMHL